MRHVRQAAATPVQGRFAKPLARAADLSTPSPALGHRRIARFKLARYLLQAPAMPLKTAIYSSKPVSGSCRLLGRSLEVQSYGEPIRTHFRVRQRSVIPPFLAFAKSGAMRQAPVFGWGLCHRGPCWGARGCTSIASGWLCPVPAHAVWQEPIWFLNSPEGNGLLFAREKQMSEVRSGSRLFAAEHAI